MDFALSNVDTNHNNHFDPADMANNYDSDGYEWEGIAVPDPPTPPPLSTQPLMFTTDQKWTVALLKLLDDMNVPDYVFSKILKWAHSAQAKGYLLYPANGGLSRTRNIDVLFASIKNAKQLLPSVSTIQFTNGRSSSDVITFDFVPLLLNLLQNPALMTADKMSINPLNPLMPYFDEQGRLGDALSGSVYCNAYADLITIPNSQFFVPIIQWIDRTTVTGNDRYVLKPYMFTPAIFNEKQAWGYQKFLPRSQDPAAQNQGKNQADNARNYHTQLYKALESFTTTAGRSNQTTGVQGCTAGDGSTEHNRRKRMDASKAPTRPRPDLLPFRGEGQSADDRVDKTEIDGHIIRKAFSRLIYYIAYLSRSDNPDENILLKVNWKSAYMPIHLQTGTVLKSCTCLDSILLFALRMTFGGSPNPSKSNTAPHTRSEQQQRTRTEGRPIQQYAIAHDQLPRRGRFFPPFRMLPGRHPWCLHGKPRGPRGGCNPPRPTHDPTRTRIG